jgi:hypothetical protein
MSSQTAMTGPVLGEAGHIQRDKNHYGDLGSFGGSGEFCRHRGVFFHPRCTCSEWFRFQACLVPSRREVVGLEVKKRPSVGPEFQGCTSGAVTTFAGWDTWQPR